MILRALIPCLALVTACAAPRSTPEAGPTAPAQPAAGADAVTPGEHAQAKPEPAVAAVEPPKPVVPEPPARDEAEAHRLLEAGRSIQRERGEGGAAAAIEQYVAAIAADPLCAACYWELGWSKQIAEDLDGNIKAWDRVRELEANFPELDTHYPVALMRRDQARALALLPDAGSLPEPEESPRPGPTIRLRAVGDVHMGRAWPASRARLPPNDAMQLFAGVRDQLRDADVTFGNLETALNDDAPSTKCGAKSTKCYAFRVPTVYAKALVDAGFDTMSIANNHAGDFGQAGRETTMAALDGVGLSHSGPIGDIASFEVHGLRIAMIAFHTGGGVHRVQETETARKLVVQADQKHDLVIVSFHGGAEGSRAANVPHGVEKFLGENRGDLRTFAHAVVDAGADLVLGHGPHRLRAMENYKGRLIAYSLGNFSSWETFNLSGPLGITTILDVTLAANGVATEAKLLPVTIAKPGAPVPDRKRRAIDIVRKLSAEDFGAEIFDAQGTWRRAADGQALRAAPDGQHGS